MKNLSIVITIGITLFFTYSVKSQETEFDPNKLKAEYFQDEKIKDGLIFSDKQANTFKIKNSDYSRGVYIKKDDKWLKHGAFYSISSGRVTSKTTYSYGKKHGPYEAYHSNGKLQFQYSFQDNLKEGKWYQYRDNGTLFEEREYKNGMKEGSQITYHSNEKKQFVSTYVNGKRHGESLQYNDEGKLVSRTQYKEGKQIGKTQWY